jgi:hypothetical protein
MLTDVLAYKTMLKSVANQLNQMPLHELDTNTVLLNEAFILCYEAKLFDLHSYEPSLQDELKLALFSALCPLSGSLAFLTVQILAANRIMQSNDFTLAQSYYQKRCGIIINHLRAPKTVISAEMSENGYALSGKLRWASGYKIFDTLVVGFHYEGEEMQAVMPFKEEVGCEISLPDETFVGVSMNTVMINLDKYNIPKENIINSQSIGFYTQQKSISKTVHYALYGIGLGAISVIDDEEIKSTATRKLEAIKAEFNTTKIATRMDHLRIELFNLIQETITVGMVLDGGKSILITQTLQRYYRELIMFNSNGLNSTIKALYKNAFLKNNS